MIYCWIKRVCNCRDKRSLERKQNATKREWVSSSMETNADPLQKSGCSKQPREPPKRDNTAGHTCQLDSDMGERNVKTAAALPPTLQY